METKAKLTQYLQELTKQKGTVCSEAIVEPNPANPTTATIILNDPLKAEVLVSCRIVPDNQYILAKLADFNWIGLDYSSVKYPLLGQQVIVLFLHGDINSGVIIGRMPSLEEPVHPLTSMLNTIRKDEYGNEEVWDTLGIKTTDVNTNELVWSIDGTSLTDLFGNEIETSITGIRITDFSANEISTSIAGITITSPTGVTISITPAGVVSITAASEVDITAPLTVIDGALEVTGTVLSTGALTAPAGIVATGTVSVTGSVSVSGGDVTADTISLKSHTHLYAPGPGSPVQTAVPTP